MNPMSADHPLRRRLSDVLHERSLQIEAGPVALRSWLVLVDDEDRAAETEWLASLGYSAEAEEGRVTDIVTEDGHIVAGQVWERHREFSIYLRFSHKFAGEAHGRPPFGFFRSANFDWLSGAPGKRFRSVEIVVTGVEPDEATLRDTVNLRDTVCCDVFDGAARIWTDFRLHDDHGGGGAGRILVHDRNLRNDETARLLQTLLDIGNYRKLALLGFPVARDLFDWLRQADARLAGITDEMRSARCSDDHVMEALTRLAADVGTQIDRVRFRQGATDAYYRLTLDRLASLREQRVSGFSTMAEFIQRRLQPAMRTCEAAARRIDDLAMRTGRTTDLLRTRISLSLERQNQMLLTNMDQRSELQLRMQALVEGFSVFAISYYVFSLVKYAAEPVLAEGHAAKWSNGAAIGVIVAIVWLVIRRRRRKIEGCERP
jgi:uncharacterized membrane-anchored protein